MAEKQYMDDFGVLVLSEFAMGSISDSLPLFFKRRARSGRYDKGKYSVISIFYNLGKLEWLK
jgi:hypothetical protein